MNLKPDLKEILLNNTVSTPPLVILFAGAEGIYTQDHGSFAMSSLIQAFFYWG